MKKLYILLLALAGCFNYASAYGDWDIVLQVLQGADKVKACVGEYSWNAEEITLVDGDNDIHIPMYESLFITPLDETSIVVFRDADGPISKDYNGNYEVYAGSYYDPAPPYTLAVYGENEYRTKSVTVTMDDCSKVKIVRADETEFYPTENIIEIPYNETDESVLSIRPASYDYKLYKVEADGKAIEPGTSYHDVNLVDLSGDEPVYVENINVTANYPDDLTFKTTITLDGPSTAISYIRVNDEDVDDLKACLGAEGFDVPVMATVSIGFDGQRCKVDEVTVNGESKYVYSALTLSMIDKDQNVYIKAHEYATFDVKFNVTGAEGIIGSLGSTKIEFTEGENIVKFNEKNSYATFYPSNIDWTFETFTSDEGYDYLEDSDWRYDQKVYLTVEPNQEYTIVTGLIPRPNTMVVYLDDYTKLEPSYFQCTLDDYDVTDRMKPGYNTINFRDNNADGPFKFYCSSYDYDTLVVYKNGEPFGNENKYIDSYYNPEYPADGDVYKIYFDNDPGVHTVTFDVEDGALDGYSVVKDLVKDEDISAPVSAVGLTRFTIASKAREASNPVITVGDKKIEAENGVYTFETSADTAVKVTKSGTSEITGISNRENESADVYNLQGIRIARQASASEIKDLPAGIYIINGSKVTVK